MRKATIILLLFSLCSCGVFEPRDENYEMLKTASYNGMLPKDELHEKFATFSLKERFRLYNKFYDKSGHPKDRKLANGFRDKPEETLDLIVYDLNANRFHSHHRYFTLALDLAENTNVDVCSPKYIELYRNIITTYHYSTEEVSYIVARKFKKCGLLS